MTTAKLVRDTCWHYSGSPHRHRLTGQKRPNKFSADCWRFGYAVIRQLPRWSKRVVRQTGRRAGAGVLETLQYLHHLSVGEAQRCWSGVGLADVTVLHTGTRINCCRELLVVV
jgi:hypothetical protein